MSNFEQQEAIHEAELHHQFQNLLTEGQAITAKIEQLANPSQPMDGARFDRLLQKLREEEAENQRQIAQVMLALQTLESNG